MEGETEEKEEEELLTPPPAGDESVSDESVSDESSPDLDGSDGATSTPDEIESAEPVADAPATDESGSEDSAPMMEPENSEPDLGEPELKEENGAIDTSIKTFTQGEVDKLVGDTRVKTREKTFRYVYDRYGVKNEEELDSLVANAQRYDTQKEMYDSDKASWEQERDENSKKLTEMSETIALMQSDIDPERYEDAKLILRGKGMEITLENIQEQLATHPEWAKEKEEEKVEEKPEPQKPAMRIKALGNEPKQAPEMSEEEQAQKLFKMKW